MTQRPAFTGRTRKKETSWNVRAMDVVSRWVITVGGIGTVISVSTVFLLLLWVAFPLLLPSRTSDPKRFAVTGGAGRVLRTGVEENRSIVWLLRADGTLSARALDTGALLEERRLFPDRTITAAAFSLSGAGAALGFADGTIALGDIGFASSFIDDAAAPPELRRLGVGHRAVAGPAVAQRISPSQLRLQRLEVAFAEPVPGASAAPVRLLDRSGTGSEGVFAALHEDGAFQIVRLTRRENMMTGEVFSRREAVELPRPPAGAAPAWLLVSEPGDSALLAWPDGRGLRHVVRNSAAPVTEPLELLDGGDRTLTAVAWLLGRTSVLAGESKGRVRVWFPALAPDGVGAATLVAADPFDGHPAAVTALASSPRSRLFATGFADGTVEVRHVTSHKLLARLTAAAGTPVETLAIAPKDDDIVATAGGNLVHWSLDPGHPETTPGSLFGRVWYEGAPGPAHVWQSSAATDDFEPKLGLVPLIFGTVKATVYSLVFGVPLAVLAAIFTSEFLSPRTRMRIKPFVELMASLPSVVLGFLAALVIAPFVAGKLTVFLALVLLWPAVILAGAFLWQLIPYRLSIRLARWRFPAMFLTVPAALLLARLSGPVLERISFGGDILLWLNGGAGGLAGAWAFLLAAPATILVVLLSGRHVTPRLREAARGWTRARCAAVDIARFAAVLLASLALAVAAGALLAAAGLDPRGSVVDTYIQRNSLVVGFVMGFAIIPIIYTIAEDALSAVPDHLRSASLAAGATPWQTAWRIVIPTATSGIFSAIMIGLGRAVGETMIVLMAAGNTPILDWNVFNGFRTLSANIAVELPEAVRNSTHYRTLFLSALVLFVMTFVLNTCAEIVRIRFRKKAQEL